jgi:hypothetical protein
VVRSGEASLSDRAYMNRISTYPSTERWPVEKQMIDSWWRESIQPERSARR